MNIESDPGQQPNPGEGGSTTVANPQGTAATEPNAPQGQGGGENGGNKPAGETGDKPAADGKAGEGQDDPKEPAAVGAPAEYGDFTLPEGVQLEGERKTEALALFRKLNLSQDAAQEAINHFIKVSGDDRQRMEQAVNEQRTSWGDAAKAELGDKYDAEVAMAKTAVAAINSPKLAEAFNEHGWGNHPELIKAFAFFGRLARDSSMDVTGGNPVIRERSLEERMYPSMKKT